MTRRISSSRPMTGSSLPWRASGGEVPAVLLEGLVGLLGVLRGDPVAAPDVAQGVEQVVAPDPDPVGQGQQQVLDRQVLVAHVGPQRVGRGRARRAGAVDARLRPAVAAGQPAPGPHRSVAPPRPAPRRPGRAPVRRCRRPGRAGRPAVVGGDLGVGCGAGALHGGGEGLLGLGVQRLGSRAIGVPPAPCAVSTGRIGWAPSVWANGTRSRRYWRWVTLHRLAGLGPGRLQLGAEPVHLGLELQHPAHALEVEPGVVRLLDAAQLVDVLLAVAAAAAAGAGRVEQALALVDAQGLGVHAGQLGGHRDDVHGPGVRGPSRHLTLPRGRRVPAARPTCGQRLDRGALSSVRAFGHGHLDGDQQVAVALPPAGTPRPLTRKVRPDVVPAGTLRVTGSVEGGDGDGGAEGGLREGDRHGEGQVLAPPAEDGRAGRRAPPRRGRRPGRCRGPAAPRPLTRMRWPSSTPAGMRTFTLRARCSTPVPGQVGQGCSTTVPAPAALRADWLSENRPWLSLMTPVPPHPGRSPGGARGGARATAGVAAGVGGHVDGGGDPVDGVLEGQVQLGLEVAAPRRGPAAVPPPTPAAGRRVRRRGRPGRPGPRPGRSRRPPGPPNPPGPAAEATGGRAQVRTSSYSLRWSASPSTS